MNSSIGIPEGFIILILLFGFPFLIARKGVFNVETIIHEFMSDSEIQLRRIYFYIGYVIITYRQRFNNLLRIKTNGDMQID